MTDAEKVLEELDSILPPSELIIISERSLEAAALEGLDSNCTSQLLILAATAKGLEGLYEDLKEIAIEEEVEEEE